MPDISQIIDANWLATILSTVFSLYIFLLSVPILFFQTFMPEDVRDIYNKRFQKEQNKKIDKFRLWVILFSIFLANHLLKYILERYLPSFSLIKEDLDFVFIGIDIFILVCFILFFLASLSFFRASVFPKTNNKKKIIQEVVRSAWVNYSNDNIAQTEDIEDLHHLGLTFTKGSEKRYLLEHLKKLLIDITSDKRYDGKKLEKYFDEVVIDSICRSSDNFTEKELLIILDITAKTCSILINLKKEKLTYSISIDQRSINNCVYTVFNIALERQYETVFSECLKQLHAMPNLNDDYFFRACNKGWEHINYRRFIAGKLGVMMGELTLVLDNNKINAIAILSWFWNSDNIKMKEFAKANLYPALKSGLITYNDLSEGEDELLLFFDTAQSIYNMKIFHFTDSGTLNTF